MSSSAVGVAPLLDLKQHPTAQLFVDRCVEFFDEVKDLYVSLVSRPHSDKELTRSPRTPGEALERRLNREYGPGNPYYEDFCRFIKQGLGEGWAATAELDGPKYRRSRILAPSPESHHISITTVFMDSQEEYRGQYHAHPYGEINCVVQLDETAELKGMHGWQGAGWTCPGAGTHHYPEVRGGALVALFFLPAGRISYNATPDMPQPHCI